MKTVIIDINDVGNFSSMEYFSVLAQERSFMRASERLHITRRKDHYEDRTSEDENAHRSGRREIY